MALSFVSVITNALRLRAPSKSATTTTAGSRCRRCPCSEAGLLRPFWLGSTALGSVQVRIFRQVAPGDYGVMEILVFINNSFVDSGNMMTETSREFLSKRLARVIAINLMCLVVFVVFCAVMTFGSLSLLLGYWNEHRAASVVVIMIAIVSIPGLVEFTAARFGIWQG